MLVVDRARKMRHTSPVYYQNFFFIIFFFFFQAEDGIRDLIVTGVQTCALPISFLGIETPVEASLKEAQKGQNLRHDLLDSVKKIQSYGIEVMAGFIVGFDHRSEERRVGKECRSRWSPYH